MKTVATFKDRFNEVLGGGMTKYRKPAGQNQWTGSEDIVKMTYEGAREWAEEKLNADNYETEFEVVEDGPELAIGQSVRSARESKNMTQTDLAELMGVSQSRVAELESDKGDPKISTLVKLSKALGIPAGELLK